MDKLSFYSVILINLVISVRYCTLTIRKKINPSLAMWIFFTISILGSLFSYLLEGDFGPLDNILNTSDIMLCLSVTTVILIFGDSSSRFSRFDLFCLGAVLIILFYWFVSKAHFATHLSLQLVQAIAYLPVFNRMWKSGKNSDSFLTWSLLLLVSVVSLFTAKGTLAYIYSIRATLCVTTLLLLMIRLEIKQNKLKRAGKSDPFAA
ncbi:MAG: hypothetical protein PF518_18425 [Spirochaetaceae bacterium]|jgi:hypothetical protein|nr:hypothetical protein [Spirochaetaceae bacterium]